MHSTSISGTAQLKLMATVVCMLSIAHHPSDQKMQATHSEGESLNRRSSKCLMRSISSDDLTKSRDSMICMHDTCYMRSLDHGTVGSGQRNHSLSVSFHASCSDPIGGMSGGNMLSLCCTALLLMTAASAVTSVQGESEAAVARTASQNVMTYKQLAVQAMIASCS